MFFFPAMFSSVIWIYLIAAILPAVILFRYIYNQSRMHRQSTAYLRSLFGYGVLSALLAVFLEKIVQSLYTRFVSTQSREAYIIYFAILAIGLVEEGSKYYFLKKRTWNYHGFFTRYDAIIYAVSVSFGFAVFENVKYIFNYGLSAAPIRALSAVPGHLSFAVLMGFFYGNAKYYDNHNNPSGRSFHSFMAVACPALLHGLYDGMAMLNTRSSSMIFVLIIVVVYLIIFRFAGHEAKNDRFV